LIIFFNSLFINKGDRGSSEQSDGGSGGFGGGGNSSGGFQNKGGFQRYFLN